ncbi:hypothetical protein F511_20428, partial [Dorcoceras hygrometricum]
GSMSVREYARRFSSLLAYVPHVAGWERAKRTKFIEGLNEELYTLVLSSKPKRYAEAVDRAIDIEEGLRNRRSRCEGERQYRTLISLLGSVSPYAPSGFPDYSADRGADPARFAQGGG